MNFICPLDVMSQVCTPRTCKAKIKAKSFAQELYYVHIDSLHAADINISPLRWINSKKEAGRSFACSALQRKDSRFGSFVRHATYYHG